MKLLLVSADTLSSHELRFIVLFIFSCFLDLTDFSYFSQKSSVVSAFGRQRLVHLHLCWLLLSLSLFIEDLESFLVNRSLLLSMGRELCLFKPYLQLCLLLLMGNRRFYFWWALRSKWILGKEHLMSSWRGRQQSQIIIITPSQSTQHAALFVCSLVQVSIRDDDGGAQSLLTGSPLLLSYAAL